MEFRAFLKKCLMATCVVDIGTEWNLEVVAIESGTGFSICRYRNRVEFRVILEKRKRSITECLKIYLSI